MRHWLYLIIAPWSIVAASAFFILNCTSTNDNNATTAKIDNTKAEIIPETSKTNTSVTDNKSYTDMDVVRLKTELSSLTGRVLTLEQNVESLLRTQRSGLSSETTPSIITQKDGTIIATGEVKAPVKDQDYISSAIGTAEIKIQQRKFNEAVETLSEIYKNFPNRPDTGHTMILLTKCYVETQNYNMSLEIIQDFFLRFKEHNEFLLGKLLEGKSYEGMGLKEKAIQVYRDIVSLAPKTGYAQTARAELQRLRDAQ